MTPAATGAGRDGRFHAAARAYLVYGIVYWIGAAYAAFHGIGVRAEGRIDRRGMTWIILGLVFVIVIPYLLRRRRRWFERWLLSRRDFARIISLSMAWRAVEVGTRALRTESASLPAPWGGEISIRVAYVVFFVVTVAALAFVARAAWSEERA
ncbi:MAG TPA: hypothetical protein VMR23_15735 [Candidatus Limnocylindria bacterium]|nr:hypothetical protein [Candidatus Limnocylindria bacterium]